MKKQDREREFGLRVSIIMVTIAAISLISFLVLSNSPPSPIESPPEAVQPISFSPSPSLPLDKETNKIEKDFLVDQDVSNTRSSRVAVLIPYVGASLPSWFNAFMFSAQLSSEYCDWLIFVTTPQNITTPSNVKIIEVSEHFLANRIIQMDSSVLTPEKSAYWADKFLELLTIFPYMLVEFKPALGWIFQSYILDYSHWALADLDVVIGRGSAFFSQELLEKYDIYTSSFGDINRMYLRGQLTVFRNDPFINQLWKYCTYFPIITKRMDEYFRAPPKVNSNTKGWKFQSAEGCISKIMTDQHNLTIYAGGTQFSDAFHAPNPEKETFLLGSMLVRCYQNPIDLLALQQTNFPRSIPQFPHAPSGEKTAVIRLESMKNPNCEYWVDPKYQVCINSSKLSSALDITWAGPTNIVGKSVSYYLPTGEKNVKNKKSQDGKCREGLISHFQGWKDLYYGFTTRPPSHDTHVFMVTQFGMIPLRMSPPNTQPNLTLPAFPTMKESLQHHHQHVHKQGKISRAYTGRECEGLYCLKYNEKLKGCLSYLSCRDIRYYRTSSLKHYSRSISLVVTGNEDSVSSGALERTLSSWIGHKVVVIQYDKEVSTEILEFVSRITGLSSPSFQAMEQDTFHTIDSLSSTNSGDDLSSYSICIILVAIEDQLLGFVDKTLFNIGIDMVLTDSVLLSAPGYVFPRNLTSSLTHSLYPRTKSNSESPRVFIIPSIFSNHAGQNFQMTKRNREKFCGFKDHSEILSLSLKEIRQIQQSKANHLSVDQFSNGSLNIGSFFGEESSMTPIAFNMKSCQHGGTFIRFPMELNGRTCYGNILLSILEAAGYRLHWSNLVATIESTYLSRNKKSSCESSCLYRSANQNHKEKSSYEEFSKILSRYLMRVNLFREKGIESIHTTQIEGFYY